MTQQEVVLSVLDKVVEADIELKLPLFSGQPKVVEKTVSQSLPFTFIDLFAGIGGFRSALERLDGRCRFSCEWDKYSQRTYEAWYGDIPHDDIRKVKIADIPNHDVLAAGCLRQCNRRGKRRCVFERLIRMHSPYFWAGFLMPSVSSRARKAGPLMNE